VNVFPLDPDNDNINNNYSPMWDAHLNAWTDEAINGEQGDMRRSITGFADLEDLINQGYITSATPDAGPSNTFVFGLNASNAVINCPVICQPFSRDGEAR